jgi:glycosyltransferase involved in cell wall biosynthesis
VILFDLSRLVSRAGRGTPTGIDRVELVYAEHLITAKMPVSFTLLTGWNDLGLVPRALAEEYLRALGGAWRHDRSSRQLRRTKWLARTLHAQTMLRGGRALRAQFRSRLDNNVYLLVSHHHLEKRLVIARLKERARASFVCLIHDLIPIEFPEYALPGQDQKHRRRMETAAALADTVIVNSAVTRVAFCRYLERAGRDPPVLVAPFGVDLPARPPVGLLPVKPPYFVCVGTIEARKNHLLLLNLWRQLVDELGDATPRLVLAGQRGWEAESAIDMLDRCPGLRGIVFERNDLPDTEVASLLAAAQALLLPSFAEGFGFPLVEALALRVPVLCSNLAALRETGGVVPEYLDPLDGLGWRAAVIDYSLPASPRRAAQLSRLARWRPPSWEDHFASVQALIAQAQAVGRRPAEDPAAIRAAPRPKPQIDGRETADVR